MTCGPDTISLTVSMVTYAPRRPVLEPTLHALDAAAALLRAAGRPVTVRLVLVDNGPGPADRTLVETLAGALDMPVQVIGGHGNVGYGVGHNLAIAAGMGDFHLILNPDVEMAADALEQALGFLQAHPEVGLLAPETREADGSLQYLCKRYPSLVDLFLRGFAPAALRRRFAARLARYEMRDRIGCEVVMDPPIVSGCFMLFRAPVLERLGGFDNRFFLYFEDFDLSLRAARLTRIAYVPAVRIVHHGGRAARKGWRHRLRFMRSALTFFRLHGWRLA